MDMKQMLKYPEDFTRIDSKTTEEIHISDVQDMINRALASTVDVCIIQEGDTIVIKADDCVVVSREFLINKTKTKDAATESKEAEVN